MFGALLFAEPFATESTEDVVLDTILIVADESIALTSSPDCSILKADN